MPGGQVRLSKGTAASAGLGLQLDLMSRTSVLITPSGGLGTVAMFLQPGATAVVFNFWADTRNTSENQENIMSWWAWLLASALCLLPEGARILRLVLPQQLAKLPICPMPCALRAAPVQEHRACGLGGEARCTTLCFGLHHLHCTALHCTALHCTAPCCCTVAATLLILLAALPSACHHMTNQSCNNARTACSTSP